MMGRWNPVRLLLMLALGLVATATGVDLAAAQSGAVDGLRLEAVETAPVIVDGVDLFRIRGTSTYPARQRAGEVAKRIATAAQDPAVSPDSVLVVPDDLGLSILVGRHRLVTLVDSDARAEDIRLSEFAAVASRRIQVAIDSYRRDREPGRTLRNALVVTAVGAVLALVLWLLVRVTRRGEQWFARRYQRAVDEVQSRTLQLVRAERFWWVLRFTTRAIRILAVLILVYAFLNWALALFPWTRLIGRTLLRLASDPVRSIAHGFVNYLPELFFLIVLTLVARWALRAIAALFGAIERRAVVIRDFDPEWAQPTFRIVRFLVFALFVVVAYPYIPGSDSGAFKGVSLLIGLLVSMGSSSVIANLIAGYTLIYRRAFRIGDRIRVGEHVGDVTARRPFGVVLRTPKNEEVTIPNSEILGSPITNYSALALDGGLILHTIAGIGYEVPWRQVEAMLLLAAERTEGLLRDRPAFVLQVGLGDFCVQYELNVYCGSAQQMPMLYTALHRNIQDVFNENGVQIMTPAYETDPATPKIVPPERWHDPPAPPPG